MEQQPFQLIDSILAIAEIAEQRGLLETENYLHTARAFVFFDNAMRMAVSGEDPEFIKKHLADSVIAETDPAQKLLKGIVSTAIPLIISGNASLLALRLRLLKIVPDAERPYNDKLFALEKSKIAFYNSSVTVEIDPQTVSRIEDFFIRRITGGHPLDMSGITYNTIATSLLGCSLAVRIKIFDLFPSIEAEQFIGSYSPGRFTAEEILKSINDIADWERNDTLRTERIRASQLFGAL